MTKLFPHLANPALKRLLSAQIPADFADWLDFVAIGALLAFVWAAEPFVFAILAVSMGLPYLLVGPFAGVLVDQVDTRQVLILSNLGRGVVTALMFLAPHWEVLMVLIALRASVDAFFTPAKQSAIQALAATDERMAANGLSHAINQASKIVAPAVGGGLLIWVAPHTVFLLNAAVSVLATLLLVGLPQMATAPGVNQSKGIRQEMRDGLREVQGSSILRSALMMMAGGYFAMFFYDTLIAPLTRDLGFSQTMLGLSLAAVGAGGVIGSLWVGTINTKARPFVLIAAGSLIAALMVFALGWAEVASLRVPAAPYLMMFAVLGLCSAMAVVPFRTVLQNHTTPERIGRVTALSEALNTIALLTAPFIGAAIASASSIGVSFMCGAGVMLIVAAQSWRLRDRA